MSAALGLASMALTASCMVSLIFLDNTVHRLNPLLAFLGVTVGIMGMTAAASRVLA